VDNLVTPLREAMSAGSPQNGLRRSSSLRLMASSQVEDIVTRIKAGQALLAEKEAEVAE